MGDWNQGIFCDSRVIEDDQTFRAGLRTSTAGALAGLPSSISKLEKLFRTFIGWAEVAFEAVETVGVAAFDDADAFGAA